MVREVHPAAAVRLALLGVCTRGAGTSLYDYADYAERLLQIRVLHVFCCCSSSPDALFRRHVLALRDRFGAHVVHEISRWPPNVTTDVDPLLSASHVTDLCAFCHVVHRLHIYIHAVQRRHVRGAFIFHDSCFSIESRPVFIADIQKTGLPSDGVLSNVNGVRNLIHAVVDARFPHGDAYARNAPSVPGCWLVPPLNQTWACAPVVPHIARPPEPSEATLEDLRADLGIPPEATVFGRHGATFTFSLRFVRQVVIEVALRRPDIWFLFLTTEPFCHNYGLECSADGRHCTHGTAANTSKHHQQHPSNPWSVSGLETGCPFNIVHLNASVDKLRFIKTCDAMLHGRRDGETFGLAIADFAVRNKPVLTCNTSTNNGRARAHLDILGPRGVHYSDRASLEAALLGFNRAWASAQDWRAYTEFEPQAVMQQFKSVFLDRPAGRYAHYNKYPTQTFGVWGAGAMRVPANTRVTTDRV